MVIAGEPSGDTWAAELVHALRSQLAEETTAENSEAQPLRTNLAPLFFGAGGPKMAQAGVDLHCDLTRKSVIGPTETARNYFDLRKSFYELLNLAESRQADLVLLVDFSYFNHQFARAVRKRVRQSRGEFRNWSPRIVKYISPQVWASRPGRAKAMLRDLDLLLCIFPFEKEWYRERVPQLLVEYVGHPILDRYPIIMDGDCKADKTVKPLVVLLPGSREGELRRHLPPLLGASLILRETIDVECVAVLPNEVLASGCRLALERAGVRLCIGGLSTALRKAAIAIASTGSVTMECARFGVPTITLYKTSWLTYQIARSIIRVDYLAMPNILAGRSLFPEFIQSAATSQSIGKEAIRLLEHPDELQSIREGLTSVIQKLGVPGASIRAAKQIVLLLRSAKSTCRTGGHSPR